MPTEGGEDGWIPATGDADSCEPPCGWWELNLGPLQEQKELLTTNPPLQFLNLNFNLPNISNISCLQVAPFIPDNERTRELTTG